MIDLSKFISNKKILAKIVTLYYNFFLKKKLKKKERRKPTRCTKNTFPTLFQEFLVFQGRVMFLLF